MKSARTAMFGTRRLVLVIVGRSMREVAFFGQMHGVLKDFSHPRHEDPEQ